MASIDWTEEAIARLRALWDENHSTAEIGRRLGTSKNSIIGKAHRLALPPRRSPIRGDHGSAPRTPAPRRVRGPTLPAVPSAAGSTQPSAPVPTSRPPQTVPRYAGPSGRPCCWPLGDPGRPGFRFCEKGTAPGKPYCAAHAEAAYVQPRAARDRPDGASLDRYLRDLTRAG